MLVQIFPHLGILQILRVRLQRVDGRITLRVGTALRQSIEAARSLLRRLGNGLLEVTARGRHRSEEGDRTRLAVVELHKTGTSIEVRDDGREVHREGVLSGQLLQTVRDLTQRLSPTRRRVGHNQHLQTHRTVILADGHTRIYRRLTRRNGHVRRVADDDRTLHELVSRAGIHQLGELGEDLHHLVCTLAARHHDDHVGIGLLRYGVLQHRLARTEGSGNEARTTLGHGVKGVDGTHTRLHHARRTRLLGVAADGLLYGPLLHHRYIVFVAVGVGNHGHRIGNLVLAGRSDALDRIAALHDERHHDLVVDPLLLDMAQPRSGRHLVARLGYGLKLPLAVEIYGVGDRSARDE